MDYPSPVLSESTTVAPVPAVGGGMDPVSAILLTLPFLAVLAALVGVRVTRSYLDE